jgi:NADH-quinone oxidoreductase subunit M
MICLALLAVPLMGALWCYQMRDRSAPGWCGFFSSLSVLLSIALLLEPKGQSLDWNWLPELGLQFQLAPTPTSLLMLLLTPLLTLVSLGMLRPGMERRAEYCGHLLLVQASLQGLFLADNLGLFYIFFELMLLPGLLLAARWGGDRGRSAALKFFLYTLVGSLPMLLGVLTLAIRPDGNSLRFSDLQNLPAETQMAAFWLFALAFLVKTPIFPLHGWQVDLYRTAPAPALAVIGGAMSKAGLYGIIRVILPLFPLAVTQNTPLLGGLLLFSLLYAACCALGAPCLRSILAYSSLSHLSLVALALFLGGPVGMAGAQLQMFSHGVATGGLFLVVAALENRGLSGELKQLGGLARPMPALASLALVLAMASLGCPGLCSFPAELAMLIGIYKTSWSVASWASLAVIVAGWYGLRFYQGTWNGPLEGAPELADLQEREWLSLIPLVVLCFAIGLSPDGTLMQWTRGLI